MLVRWGKSKKLAKVERMEGGVVCCLEMPPGSGQYYLPLIRGGRNVEQYEIVHQEQMSLWDSWGEANAS